VHTLSIRDVASKITGKKTVKSSEFFCRHDPDLATFISEVRFGEKEVSFYVHVVSKTVRSLKLRFKLIGNKGVILVDVTVRKSSILNADTPDSGWGCAKIYTLKPEDAAEAKTWLFVCGIDYEVPPTGEVKPAKESSSCGSSLQADLLSLWEATSNADVTFVVQGEEIKGHKGILSARCEYFKRMFASETKENVTNKVVVPDVKPVVFRAMLQFFYSDTLPKDFDKVSLELLVAADKYGAEKLKQKCESDAPVHAENLVDALLVAESVNSESLMKRALDVFGTNPVVLMQSERVKSELSQNLMFELLSHFVQKCQNAVI